MAQPSSGAVRGHAERSFTVPVGRLRTELVRALGQSKFTITIDQLTVLEGSRGNSLGGASRNPDKVPLYIQARISGSETGSSVAIHLFDQWKLPVSRPLDVYQGLVQQILDDIDQVLRRMEPSAGEFEPATISGIAFGGGSGSSGRAAARASGAAHRFLEGGSSASERRRGWRDHGEVVIVAPKASTVFQVDQAYGLVTVGTLVASRPGGMPRPMVAQVEHLVSRLEQVLQGAGQGMPTVWVQIEDSSIPVVEFLAQQAKIREQVALRTLQVCTTCRLAKVVNPDYAKLRAKRHRTNVLTNSVGAVISPVGISPFVLVGRLAQLNQLDTEYVCPRCQGLHSENSLITFCPQCGEQRDESALRSCQKCSFDFRSLASTKDLWTQPPETPPFAPSNETPPVPAPWPAVSGTAASAPWPAASGTATPAPWPAASGTAASAPWPAASAGNAAAAWPPAGTAAPSTPSAPVVQQSFPPAHAAQSAHSPQPVQNPQPIHGAAAYAPWPASVSISHAAHAGGTHSAGHAANSHPAHASYTNHTHVASAVVQNWYPDPAGRHQLRWWDGAAWTHHVRDAEVAGIDPLS